MLTLLGPRRATVRLSALTVVGIVAVVAYLVVMAWAMTELSFDIWGAMIVGPLLVGISMPILNRVLRGEPDATLRRIVLWAFGAKLLGSILRYVVTFQLYAGRSDAGGYHGSGRRLANAFWMGDWSRVFREEVPEVAGTEFLRLVTGLVYIVTGPTKLGGFLVFGWLGFWGLLLFTRAFRLAVPDGDHRRYALLTFFLPSLIYWPSSIGKEAWMLFMLGIVAYGAARLLSHRPDGFVLLVIGLIGTGALRPHMTLLCFLSVFAAMLVRRRSWREARLGLIGRLLGLGLLAVVGVVVLARTADFFNVDQIDGAGVSQVFDRTQEQTAGEASSFDPPRLTSPAQFPGTLVSVLFRPFPWEANNEQALVTALESTALIGLVLASWRRLATLPSTLVRVPYATFAAVYIAGFAVAFSAIGNFGLLARQRTQVLPFVLVLLSLPAVSATATTVIGRARAVRPTRPARPLVGSRR